MDTNISNLSPTWCLNDLPCQATKANNEYFRPVKIAKCFQAIDKSYFCDTWWRWRYSVTNIHFLCDACVTFVALHLVLFILKKSQFLDWFAVLKLSFWFFGAREIRSQGRKDQILNCTLSPNSSLYSLEDRPTDTESYDSYPEAACICGVSVSNLKDSILKINRFDYLFKPYPTVDYFKTNWTIFLAVQSTRNASKFM